MRHLPWEGEGWNQRACARLPDGAAVTLAGLAWADSCHPKQRMDPHGLSSAGWGVRWVLLIWGGVGGGLDLQEGAALLKPWERSCTASPPHVKVQIPRVILQTYFSHAGNNPRFYFSFSQLRASLPLLLLFHRQKKISMKFQADRRGKKKKTFLSDDSQLTTSS